MGEKFGTVAISFTGLGALYVLLKRFYLGSKLVLKTEEQKDQLDKIKNFYKKFRLPVLQLHYISLIIATVAASIHGFFLFGEDTVVSIFGSIAVLTMIMLSTAGIIIWRKFKRIWNHRESRTVIRYVHRQWLFTIIFLTALLFHFVFE